MAAPRGNGNGHPKPAIVLASDSIESFTPKFAAALPSVLNVERFKRVALNCLQLDANLMQAIGTPHGRTSYVRALLQCAQLGLEPGGALGFMYLVPFYNKHAKAHDIVPIPGYQGLVELALRSDRVISIWADVVRRRDEYKIERGSSTGIKHEPGEPGDDDGDERVEDKIARGSRAEIVAAYACAQLEGQTAPVFVWLWRREIDKVRNASRAGKSGPWVDWFPEMATKTAVRRLFKLIPKSVDVRHALDLEERLETGTVTTTGTDEPMRADKLSAIVNSRKASEDAPPEDAQPYDGPPADYKAGDDTPREPGEEG